MILVTGGTGLAGSHLLYELCSRGKAVRAIKRPGSDVSRVLKTFAIYSDNHLALFNHIEWVDADVLDIFSLDEALKGVNQVYHCAGMVSFSASAWETLFRINVEGTANLVDACLRAGVEKFCHISSIAALGRDSKQGVITENTAYEQGTGNSMYARSKYAGECEVWKAAVSGLKVIVLYPSIILGPGEWERSSVAMITTVWKGLRFYTKGVNGYVDVRDVAEVSVRLMDSEIENEGFLLSAEDVSYRDLFSMIAGYMGKSAPSFYANRFLSHLGWMSAALISVFTGKPPLLTKATARTAHQRYYFSSEKTERALNFKFRSINESVKHTVEVFLRELPAK